MKANTLAKKIKDEENGGSGNIHIIGKWIIKHVLFVNISDQFF